MHKLLIDMLSHFVKDAKNWDEYVPYAVVAYRAMPHSTTKYSPYYLVYGRETRLPIKYDWKRSGDNVDTKENEHERRVRELTERLREANRTAGQQFKMSHNTAKRYYDRYTKVEQFKEDYVYVHNPVHRRGKAKKFPYQYNGPFEVQQISPLIYKIRLGDGTFIILHVNGPKREHKRETGNRVLLEEKLKRKTTKPTQPRGASCEKREDQIKKGALEEAIPPPYAPVEVQEDLNKREGVNELSRKSRGDPEWVPGLSYLHRKLRSSTTADNVAYKLYSRLVGRSEQETEVDNEQAEAVSLQESENVSKHAQ